MKIQLIARIMILTVWDWKSIKKRYAIMPGGRENELY
jgi:hypothetical protein